MTTGFQYLLTLGSKTKEMYSKQLKLRTSKPAKDDSEMKNFFHEEFRLLYLTSCVQNSVVQY